MAVFKRIVDFLPQNTKLMVLVKPSRDIDPALEQLLVSNIKTVPPSSGLYVPLFLDEPLRIEFSVSNAGNLSRQLKPCKCHTPILPNAQLASMNNANQVISESLEKHRISHVNKVYERFYFQDDDYWRLIDDLRERIYQPYQVEFEEHMRIIKEKVGGYVKPLSELPRLLASELEDKDKRITSLLSEKQNLDERIGELITLLEKSKLVAYREKLDEFQHRLKNDYPEANGRDSWQEWIYKNNWLFGVQYDTPIGHPQVGFRSTLDYLFPTPDGFVDILEIKKPTHNVIIEDKSHPGAFRWSGEVTKAIGQVVNYLQEIELHQLEIAKKLKDEHSIELSAIKPRAFILVGRSDNWNDKEKEAFRRLNHSLHGIEILTYTDLLQRGKNLIRIYAD